LSRAKIFSIYIAIDLVIVAVAVWCGLHRIPVRQFLVPVIVLFCLNGVWLIWMTVRNTPFREEPHHGDTEPRRKTK
jgi:TctA family transporter